MHLASSDWIPARRVSSWTLTACLTTFAVLGLTANAAAAAPHGDDHLAKVTVGHFSNTGRRVTDKSFVTRGASGRVEMSPKASAGRLPKSLGGERVARVALRSAPQGGATISSSGTGWAAGSPGYSTAFGCGWTQINEYATGWIVAPWEHRKFGETVVHTDWCWAYGVRIYQVRSAWHRCNVLYSGFGGKSIYTLRGFYTLNGWPNAGYYNKAKCEFTFGPTGYDVSPWVHIYSHSDGSVYWSRGT